MIDFIEFIESVIEIFKDEEIRNFMFKVLGLAMLERCTGYAFYGMKARCELEAFSKRYSQKVSMALDNKVESEEFIIV